MKKDTQQVPPFRSFGRKNLSSLSGEPLRVKPPILTHRQVPVAQEVLCMTQSEQQMLDYNIEYLAT